MDTETKPRVYLIQRRVKLTEKRHDRHFTWTFPSSPPCLLLEMLLCCCTKPSSTPCWILLAWASPSPLQSQVTCSSYQRQQLRCPSVEWIFINRYESVLSSCSLISQLKWEISADMQRSHHALEATSVILSSAQSGQESVICNVFSDQQTCLWALQYLKNTQKGVVVAADSFRQLRSPTAHGVRSREGLWEETGDTHWALLMFRSHMAVPGCDEKLAEVCKHCSSISTVQPKIQRCETNYIWRGWSNSLTLETIMSSQSC